ncbi:MAG TPA: DUF2059 domain-containing protein [Opitutaceae bacterium]|nr:DUF2059 domain-containing protein [Opitutaceae bacterium]
MKLSLFSLCAALLTCSPLLADTGSTPVTPAPAADAPKLEFRGLLATGGEHRFLLSSPGGTKSDWLDVGDSFQNWTIDSYNEKDGTLVLKNSAGSELHLQMTASVIGKADIKATLADAQKVMEKLHFGEMLIKILNNQKTAQIAMIREMLEKRGMSPDQIEKIIAQQTKAMDRIWASFDAKELQNAMAQIYSEEYTPDQLAGISEFYDTPAGQASLEKAPEIQQKIMKFMMPKILAAQQQMVAEAKAQKAAEQAAQAQKAPAGAPAPAAPAAAPAAPK